MYKASPENYKDYIPFAETVTCGDVYPLSIAQGFQPGDIYADSLTSPKAVLFHHKNGFAFISGTPDKAFLLEVLSFIVSPAEGRRFVLLSDNDDINQFFASNSGIIIEQRTLFAHKVKKSILFRPDGYEITIIDNKNLELIEGRIVPSSFWQDSKSFLEKGFGFCALYNGAPVAWAFSASVSEYKIDIGVETHPDHRGKHLARCLSRFMVYYARYHKDKAPVWGCHTTNIASFRTASGAGFVPVSECAVIKKRT